MKVIVAGFPKTGTKSMNSALTQLGYKVYDYPEHMFLLNKEYIRIWNEGWTADDFREMYRGVDAVVDVPVCFFWEELHQAFPDAKIILTMRDNEDVWFKSYKNQAEIFDKIFYKILRYLSPTAYVIQTRFFENFIEVALAAPALSLIRPVKYLLNDQLMKKKYRAHNANVLQSAPKDKLLVYKCSEGWEPLCNFLEVDVPDTPFPRRNVGGHDVKIELMENPGMKKIIIEVIISLGLLVTTAIVGSYLTYKHGVRGLPEAIWNCGEALYNGIKSRMW